MATKKLNICLHSVVEQASDIETIYDMTVGQLESLVLTLQQLTDKGVIDDYELFFDDGYQSFYDVAQNVDFGIPNNKVHGAIITEQIGLENKMSEQQIATLSQQGFIIDSHGVSHAALAVFQDETLRATPQGGEYVNSPYGKKRTLSEQEVLYQLEESSIRLESIIGGPVRSFVLPYGLYNATTVMQAAALTSYSRLYSCDEAFDTGQYLAPRLLVTQENIDTIVDIIRALSRKPMLLTASHSS